MNKNKNTSTADRTFQLNKTDFLPVLIFAAIFFMTWLFMHGVNHFLALTPEALGKYYDFKWIIIAHITAGGGTLIFGIIQFWKKLRTFSWQLHRIVGFIYLLAVLVSSTCALILAFTTTYEVSWAVAFTLQIWAGVWLSATIIAYYMAVKKRFKLHHEWMVRSYIITLGFLISGFALKIHFIQELGKTEDIQSPLFWMGWSVPLFIYEIIKSSKTSH